MVKVYVENDRHIVTVTPALMQRGWYGGQWVRYIGKKTIDLATNTSYAGFLLYGYKKRDLDAAPYDFIDTVSGSDFVPMQHENRAIDALAKTVIIADSGEFEFNKYAFDTTQIYTYNQELYVNNNAILTNQNTGGPPVGIVISAPQDNNNWLGMMLKY